MYPGNNTPNTPVPFISPEREQRFCDALAQATSWSCFYMPDPETTVYIPMTARDHPLEQELMFTRNELRAIGPGFDKIMDGLLIAKNGPVPARLMQYACSKATGPKLQIPTTEFAMRLSGPNPDIIKQAEQVVWFGVFPGEENPSIRYVCAEPSQRDYAVRTTTLEPDWLDSQFPGWRDRFAFANALGLDCYDTIDTVFDTVFTKAPEKHLSVTLPSISDAI